MRALILAPHTDDGELGCGGTIAKMVAKGAEVRYLAFSAGSALTDEVRAATLSLGIPPSNLSIQGFETRNFPAHRQEILEILIAIQRDWRPDRVFLPCTTDTHQDHQTVSAEGFRAFKCVTMLGYELPWNNLTFPTSAFVVLSENNVSKKVEALQLYDSQKSRDYFNPGAIESLARVRGMQIGVKFAESFQVIRWMIDE